LSPSRSKPVLRLPKNRPEATRRDVRHRGHARTGADRTLSRTLSTFAGLLGKERGSSGLRSRVLRPDEASSSLSPGVDGGLHGVDDPSDFVFVSAAPDGEVEPQHERHEQIGSLAGNAVASGSLALRLTDESSQAFA